MKPAARKYSKFLLWLAIILLVIAGFWLHGRLGYKNTIPADIQSELRFKAAYPQPAIVDSASYDYQSGSGILSYGLNFVGTKLTVNEQQPPPSVTADPQGYLKALGIKPTAQFNSPIGPVAITAVYSDEHPVVNGGVGPQPVKSEPIGQSAISLTNQGTLLIIRPSGNQTLTIDQWKSLFSKLKNSP